MSGRGGRDAAATFSCRNAVFRCAATAAAVKKENGERGRESFDDTELGGENLSAAVVDDCPFAQCVPDNELTTPSSF